MKKNQVLAASIAALLAAFALNGARQVAADQSATPYVWKPVRIGAGGWMRGMAIDSAHPSVRYARGDVDNLYRWDGVAGVWIPTKIVSAFPKDVIDAPTPAGCGAIAIDPRNPKVVLCAYTFRRSADISGSDPSIKLNVYRSVDGGRTFSAGDLSLDGELENETIGERLAFDPNNDSIVYFGSPSNGFWRSEDGGVHWSKVDVLFSGAPVENAGLPRFAAAAGVVKVDGKTVSRRILLTTEAGGVLVTDDGGQTWIDAGSGSDFDNHAGFTTYSPDGSFWITDTSEGRLWRLDASNSWTSVQSPFGSLSGVAVDPRNADRLFVINGGGALARSLDAGKTWVSFGSGLTFSETQPIEWLRPSAIRPQQHYISNGGIYMDDSGRLWIPGANDGILSAATSDSADTPSHPPVFTSVSEGIEEMVAQTIALPPGGRPVLTVEDETCFTIDDPDTFTAKHFDLNLWDGNNGLSSAQDINYCPNVPNYLVITSDNAFSNEPTNMSCHFSSYSLDGGSTWTKFGSIMSGVQPAVLYDGIIAVSAATTEQKKDMPNLANIVWVAGEKYGTSCPAPFYSTDGGKTWTQSHSFDTAPGSFLYAASGETYRYMGPQWGPWNVSLKQHNLVADPLKPGVFYLHLTGGGFWRSTDGGVTWVQTTGTSQVAAYTHHGQMAANPFKSGDIWYIDGYEGATEHGLWHSTDGGDSFQKVPGFDHCWCLTLGKSSTPGGYPSIYIYGKTTDNRTWGVFRSADKGTTWSQISGYPTGLLDRPDSMAASWDRFGEIYVGFSGNSFVYGYPGKSGD